MVFLSHSMVPRVLIRRLSRERGPVGSSRSLHAEMERRLALHEPTQLTRAVYKRDLVTFPLVNLASGESQAILMVELPGVTPEEISVEVLADTVSISGARKSGPLDEGEGGRREERFSGTFRREVALPFEACREGVHASYSNGILTVSIPRAEVSKPKRIVVKE